MLLSHSLHSIASLIRGQTLLDPVDCARDLSVVRIMDVSRAALYANNSRAQFLWNTKHLSDIEWGPSLKVVDVGCGTGESTKQLLAQRDDVDYVLAFDASSSMVDYAKEHNSDEKISYVVAGIEDHCLVDKIVSQGAECNCGTFDRVVALNVLHWVKCQTDALRNITSLLQPGGDCLLVIGNRPPHAFLHAKNEILETETWKGLIHDDVNWRHARHPEWAKHNAWRQPDPARGYQQLCEQPGLVVSHSEVCEVTYAFESVEECKGMLQYLLPHSQQVPADLLPQFMEDVYDLFQSLCPKDSDGCCVWNASFLVVHAHKPRPS